MEILKFNDFITEDKSNAENRIAVGVAIIWNNKILLVHPTNSTWQRGTCGIPKGQLEPGEEPLIGALRELKEETNISLTPSQLDPEIQTVIFYRNGKPNGKLLYFVCNISSLFEIGLSSPKLSNFDLQLEEVDWAKFVTPEEAYPLMSRSQLIILDRHLILNK
jgi:8-oxo-dGTP pyrophosphatase MutT (NUDIX family)